MLLLDIVFITATESKVGQKRRKGGKWRIRGSTWSSFYPVHAIMYGRSIRHTMNALTAVGRSGKEHRKQERVEKTGDEVREARVGNDCSSLILGHFILI